MTSFGPFQYTQHKQSSGYVLGNANIIPIGNNEGYNLYAIRQDYRRQPTIREEKIEGLYKEFQGSISKQLTQYSEPKKGFFDRAEFFERNLERDYEGYSKRRYFDAFAEHLEKFCHIRMKEKEDGTFLFRSTFKKKNGEIVVREWIQEAKDRSKDAYAKAMKSLAESVNIENAIKKTVSTIK